MVAAGNPLAIAALQAQQNHPLMAQQASAQLAAAQQVWSLLFIIKELHFLVFLLRSGAVRQRAL